MDFHDNHPLCYHFQQGMTYPHNQEMCDHVPDIEGSFQMQQAFPTAPNNVINYPDSYPQQQYYDNRYTPYPLHNGSFEYPVSNKQNSSYKERDQCNNYDSVEEIYKEISNECEHLILKGACKQCNDRAETESVMTGSENDKTEDIVELASSMKRKREQNKKAAARYRQKKKQIFTEALSEIQKLERRRAELEQQIKKYSLEVNNCRKTLGLPSTK